MQQVIQLVSSICSINIDSQGTVSSNISGVQDNRSALYTIVQDNRSTVPVTQIVNLLTSQLPSFSGLENIDI